MKRNDLSGEDGLNQFDAEAAAWFARMRGPEADEHRAAFEKWLSLGALHRTTYDRIAEIWEQGEALKAAHCASAKAERSPSWSAGPIPGARRPRATALWLLPLAAAGLTCLLLPTVARHLLTPTVRPASITRGEQLSTKLGEIRRAALPDGSIVILDTDSLLSVSFDTGRRETRLERGRIRFEVAHEARPFIVDAGAGAVVARGTIFDVGVTADRQVHVLLLKGSVDVRVQPHGQWGALVRRLSAGDAVAYPLSGRKAPLPEAHRPASWPTGQVEYDGVPLAIVIQDANRYSARKIRFTDPVLGDLRVSGSFQIADTTSLAESLAALFGIKLTTSSTELILSKK